MIISSLGMFGDMTISSLGMFCNPVRGNLVAKQPCGGKSRLHALKMHEWCFAMIYS